MENNKKDDNKWINEAFKEATAGLSMQELEEKKALIDHIVKEFKKDFPRTMTAFCMAFGEEHKTRLALMFLSDPIMMHLVKCFFISGYETRMDEEKEGKK